MSKYVIFIVVMVLMAGIFHMLFIGFDYVFHNPDSGLVTVISENANETMTSEYRNRTENRTTFLRQAFGISRVICVGLAVVVPVIGVLKRPRGE